MTRLSRPERVLVALVALLLCGHVVVLLLPSSGESAAAARSDLVASAEARVPAVLEYGSQDPEGDLAVVAANVTDGFRPQHEALLRQAIGAAAPGSVFRNDVEIEHVALVESGPTSGVVLVVLRQTRTDGDVAQEPRLGRLEVAFVKDGDAWLVDRITPV